MVGNGHPFYIKSTSSTSGILDEFTNGVTRTGSSDSSSNGDKLIFTVPYNAPANLWYQCSAHPNMKGQINIIDSTDGYGNFSFQVHDEIEFSENPNRMIINITDV